MKTYRVAARTGRWICAVALALFALPAVAQERADVWTEARVRERAERRSPRVNQAEAELDAAGAPLAFSRVSPVGNPVLSMRAMVGFPDETAATYSALVGFPFDVSGVRSAWRGETRYRVEAAEAQLQTARADARAEALGAWAALLVAGETVRTAEDQLTTARELLARTRGQVAAHAATALDEALAEREASATEAALVDARRERDAAADALRAALDLGPQIELAVPAAYAPSLPEGLDRESAAVLAARRRGEPRALRLEAQRWRASDGRLRAQAVAPLTLNAEVELQGNANRATTVGVSASWSLPVVQTNQGERALATSEAQLATVRSELAVRTARREGAAAVTEFTRRLEALRAVDASVVPASERVLALTNAMLQAGAVDLFRVLAARRDLFTARRQRLDALREAWRARASLERAMGGTDR